MPTTTLPPTTTIWEQTRFDSGQYLCRVERLEDRSGRLTVTLMGHFNHVIHEEPIALAIGDHGTPLAEEDKWRSLCQTVISNPDQRSSMAVLRGHDGNA